MAVQSILSSGELLCYFSKVGKDGYRPSECYVPTVENDWFKAPEGSTPGDIVMAKSCDGKLLCEVRLPPEARPGQICKVEFMGYTVPPVDVFVAGVCLFTLNCQGPAFASARRCDSCFAFMLAAGDDGPVKLATKWNKRALAPAGMSLMAAMMRSDPARRPTIGECLASAWFASLDGNAASLVRACADGVVPSPAAVGETGP
eukprot:NODE_1247_length_1195_cov_273.118421.p1 GENE.NODE_1247_length_1195_cov_273.118421~~NODE_1247_length_1195_cov_273.118421.p1  ORF type:complete len:215 (-),score=54.50 NODE_1247_length_1195_cov_273.118421:535-1140(-)